MAPPPSILVLGAGELGSEVLQSLITHPAHAETKITLVLRPSTISTQDTTKRAEIERYSNHGVHILAGDAVQDSSAQMAALFAPFHTVISCTGMTFPPGTHLKIARAVLQAGVRRFFPWQFGIDYDTIGRNSAQDLFDEQLDVRDLLRSQNETDWVIVSTGMFISFLFEPSFGLIDSNKRAVTAIGSWENSLTVTSPEDIGKIVADLALVSTDEKGMVFVAGDTVSMRELAGIVERVTGKPYERKLKDPEQLKHELEAKPEDVMRKYRGVFGAGVGVSWPKESSFNMRKQIETVSVEQWARRHL